MKLTTDSVIDMNWNPLSGEEMRQFDAQDYLYLTKCPKHGSC